MTASIAAFLGFIAAVAAVAVTGVVFKPGAWYERIRKPGFTPPDWLFPIAWSVLYLMIAVSGFLVWREVGIAGAPVAFLFFAAQLVFNAAWSPLFFGAHRPDLAMADLGLLWFAILATILSFWEVSVLAALLLAPYLIWVTYAGALNAVIWRLNGARPRPVGTV